MQNGKEEKTLKEALKALTGDEDEVDTRRTFWGVRYEADIVRSLCGRAEQLPLPTDLYWSTVSMSSPEQKEQLWAFLASFFGDEHNLYSMRWSRSAFCLNSGLKIELCFFCGTASIYHG